MSANAQIADSIESALELTTPVVAITFTDAPPAHAAAPAAAVPAGCSFWQLGAHAALATRAEHHRHCSIGIHTHNLTGAPASQPGELQVALGAMVGLDYVRPDEVASLPVRAEPSAGVLYEPLRDAPAAPTVAMLFAHGAQGLVVAEAVARVDGAMPIAMGRPACAVVPQVASSGRAATSLGCCGARAYLDAFDDGTALWCLPGDRLADYAAAIDTLAGANTVLTKFHAVRRAAIEAGETPSVEASLAGLG